MKSRQLTPPIAQKFYLLQLMAVSSASIIAVILLLITWSWVNLNSLLSLLLLLLLLCIPFGSSSYRDSAVHFSVLKD